MVIHFVRKFASILPHNGLPPNIVLLNINIPSEATQETEVRTTCQSRQNYYVCAKPERRDLFTNFQLPVKVYIDYNVLETYSEVYAYAVDGIVSVTPLGTYLTVRDAFSAPPPTTIPLDKM